MIQLFKNRRNVLGGLGGLAIVAVGVPLALPRWSDDELRQARQLQSAMYDVLAAIGLVNRFGGALAPEATAQVQALYEKAAEAAGHVDDTVLAKVHEDLPAVWRDKFRKSTDSYIAAMKMRDRDEARRASILQDDWIRWYNQNKPAMNLPPPDKTARASTSAP